MNPDLIQQEIQTVLDRMGFRDLLETIDTHQGAANRFTIRLRDEANMLIGERGMNLLCLEHVLKKLIHRKYPDEFKFTLDINDYRLKRLEGLKQDVKSAAKAVRLYRREVPLQPMSSFERRIVHLLLAEYPDIATESVGTDPERRVVIKPYP